ncbi:MAG TPA: TolC family protein [Terracidiphilus sp.]|jgi:outer membrane protein TolC
MHLYGIRVFEERETPTRKARGQASNRLRALAALMLALTAGVPSGFAQQQTVKTPSKPASDLPSEPAPEQTAPLDLRATQRDFSKPAAGLLGNPIRPYMPTNVAKASFVNSVRLTDLVKNGKIYLSLSDALALAIENNYDIAISRYYMDLADLDILRAKAGSALFGSGATVNSFTQGGYLSSAATGGGPGASTGGAASGTAGLTLTASGAGPAPVNEDPVVTSAIEFQRQRIPQTSIFSPSSSTNTDSYNFTYNQGFATGTTLAIGFNNSRITSDNEFNNYSPQLSSGFTATVTQPLLQGAGIFVNKRYVYQALNNRRITDSTFRQQILYTVNQVEDIYWGLVNAYEDVQAKQRALDQSSQVASDNRRQLQIGTMAPLDVLNADQSVASDKQALISSQSALNYQQQIIKQAIARNLNDPALIAAAVIPTDRVSLEELPEEKEPIDQLVQEAFKQSPVLEQAALTLKNDEISLKGARNGLLPTLNAYGFYGATAAGGAQSPDCLNFFATPPGPCAPNTVPNIGYGTVLNNLVNSTGPDKGVGFNVNIPIRNRTAQAAQAQALIEYRQAELRLEQLYTQIRISVVNAMYALTNDRSQVQASIAARDYAAQDLDAEQKKLKLGASTTALVLQQQRSLASADNALLQANATYAKDRAGLYQILATTLQHYGINLTDAATGNVTAVPVVPGLVPAQPGKEPTTTPPATPEATQPPPPTQ